MARLISELKDENGNVVAKLYGSEIGDQEVHIDGAWGVGYGAGICKLNLFTVTLSGPDEDYDRKEIAVRLSMSLPVFFQMKDFLIRQCDLLTEQLGLEGDGKEELAVEGAKKQAKEPPTNKEK